MSFTSKASVQIIGEMCDADFRKTGLTHEWARRVFVTPAGNVRITWPSHAEGCSQLLDHEVRLSACRSGCKIYACSCEEVAQVIHNRQYGCKEA